MMIFFSTDISNKNKSDKNLLNNEKNSNNIEETNYELNKDKSDISNLNSLEKKGINKSSTTDDKTTDNVDENKNEFKNSDLDNNSNSTLLKSKEIVDKKEIESNTKPKMKLYSVQKDGNFIWDNYGRCRYVYTDGSVPNTGFIEKNNNKYYTYGNGYIYTNQLISFGSSVLYYMGNDGRLTIGKFKDNSNKWRYSNNDGNLIGSQGWKIDKQGKHYAHGNGYLFTNQFITFGPHVRYYMNSNGLITTSPFKYENIVIFHPNSKGLISSAEYNSNIRHIRVMKYAKSILKQVGNSLWGAYKWAGSAINYKTMTTNYSNGITYFANIGFNQRKGNCYTMASAFYYMAKALGYNVHQISGYYQGYNRQWVHSWCEIHLNGKKYVYDPDIYKEFGKSIFGMRYGQKGTLKYLVERNKYMNL